MSFLDEVLRELKSRRRNIDRAITDLENEIQNSDEKTARIKEQRELIEELMAARTAPLETPTKAPTESLHYRLGLDMVPNPDKTAVSILHDNGQAELRRMQNDVMAFIQNNLGISPEKFKVEPLPNLNPEPTPEPHQHDRFDTFKYVNGKMVRVCKCELCKKRGIANG